MARELKGLAAGLIAGLAVVAASYGISVVATHGQTAKTVVQTKIPPRTPAASINRMQLVSSGAALYSSLACVGCHGAQAQGGGIGPTLHHLGDSDAKVARNIANGFPGRMPAYNDQLSPAQIDTLVAYIQSFE